MIVVFGIFGKKVGPPDAEAVLRRALVLRHVIGTAFSAPPPDVVEDLPEETRRELAEVVAAESAEREKVLREHHLDRELVVEERELLRDGPLEAPPQLLLDATWSTEACGCLVWALGHLEELPPWDTVFRTKEVFRDLPGEPGPALLRDRNEIGRAREIAELWHWRCRTRHLQEGGQLDEPIRGEMMIDDVIRMAAENAAGDGEIPPAIDGDFPAFGKPFRDLDADDYSTMTSIAMERHKAFNWLCGYAPKNRWDEVPTDT